jgi:hypothetical protein
MQARTRVEPSAALTTDKRWGDDAGPQNSKTPADAAAAAAAGERIQLYSCIKLNLGSVLGASGSSGGERTEERRMRSVLEAGA